MLPGTKGKICKGIQPAAEFAADNIDNTAPVKKIVNDLMLKNKSAADLYCQTVRPHGKGYRHVAADYDYTLAGHPLFAFPDDWEGGLNSGYFEQFPFKSLMPKMLTPLQTIKETDPVSRILKAKYDWKRKGFTYHRLVKKTFTDENEYFSQPNEEVAHCARYVVDLAAHLDSEPHPEFDDSYNWYYAGNGNLQLIHIDLEEFLLHSEFNMLYLSHFARPHLQINTDHAATYNCGEGNLILETVCSTNNIVALRTKHKIFILKIVHTDDKIEIEKIRAIESEQAYTGVSFDNHHKNILYVTNLNNTVKIVNLDRLTARTVNFASKGNIERNNWNTVISSDRVIYTHVTKNGIGLYDKRTNDEAQSWANIGDVSDFGDCNRITAAIHREGSTSLYCGTDHHLFLFDLRRQLNTKLRPILRWTHGMHCVPTYLSICNFEYNKELISLCSQWCEDTSVVPNYISDVMKEGEMPGVTMPYRTQSIFHTLEKAREKLLCLDLYNPIDERLATSVTGQVILEHGENYAILTQNSLGDISCHILYPEHMDTFIEDNGIEHLVQWSASYKEEKKPYEVSTVEDISRVWEKLQKIPDTYQFDKPPKLKTKKAIQKEVEQIFEKEGLDSGLLDIWTDDLDAVNRSTSNSLMDSD